MALNEDEYHPCHSVSQYFTVLKLRFPQLFLMKDERQCQEIKNPFQKASAKIVGKASKGGGGGEGEGGPAVESAEMMAKRAEFQKRRNKNMFNKQFPGQKRYMKDGEKHKRVDLFLQPDTFCITWFFNLLLITAVIMFFFNSRAVGEEYFIRQNIYNAFEKTKSYTGDERYAIPSQPFSQINSYDNFKRFITKTIPFTIFTNNDENVVAFSKTNQPLGQLKIRTQHWDKNDEICQRSIFIAADPLNDCSVTRSGGEWKQRESPIKMFAGDDMPW